MKRRNAKQGIIYPILLAVMMFFMVFTIFMVFTPFLSGAFNLIGSFSYTLNNTSLTNFIFPYMQGFFMIWMGGIVVIILVIIAYLGLSAHRDEPIE